MYIYNIMPNFFKNILYKIKNKKNKEKDLRTPLEKAQEEYFNSSDYIISSTIFHCKSDISSKKITIPILSAQ